jgi:pyrroline-5-carboxylate reductase
MIGHKNDPFSHLYHFPIVSVSANIRLFVLLSLLLLVIQENPVCSFHPNSNGGVPDNRSSSALSSSKSDNNNDFQYSMNNLSVGFIGCGTIASAIARGLARASEGEESSLAVQKMMVSMRSQSKSIPLFSELSPKLDISVESENQAIVDASDLIFLTVLPQQASEVLQSLEFDPNRHVLVSLVSTAKLEDLVRDSKLDLSRVAKMICLPSIARHKGVALLCCGDTNKDSAKATTRSFLNDIFGAMGGVVCLDTEADLEAAMVTTCTMGPLYGTMKNQRDWLLKQTDSLSKEDASFLVIKQFAGAISEAERESSENRLEALIAEQTPGGLNEQALKNYGTVLGGFPELQDPVMDAILSRIRKESDGSLGTGNGDGSEPKK